MSTDGMTANQNETYSLTGSAADAKPLVVGVLRETFREERRVALIPASIAVLKKAKLEVVVQAGAGTSAGFVDADYISAGVEVLPTREEVFLRADILLQVRTAGANAEAADADIALLRPGQAVIGLCEDTQLGFLERRDRRGNQRDAAFVSKRLAQHSDHQRLGVRNRPCQRISLVLSCRPAVRAHRDSV